MKVLVCGGRDYRNEAFLYRQLDHVHAERRITAILQGGARGADRMAREWARTKPFITRHVCKAQWYKHGKAAGGIRNARMLEWKPDLVIGFPTAESIGTWDMIRRAKQAGVETLVFE